MNGISQTTYIHTLLEMCLFEKKKIKTKKFLKWKYLNKILPVFCQFHSYLLFFRFEWPGTVCLAVNDNDRRSCCESNSLNPPPCQCCCWWWRHGLGKSNWQWLLLSLTFRQGRPLLATVQAVQIQARWSCDLELKGNRGIWKAFLYAHL